MQFNEAQLTLTYYLLASLNCQLIFDPQSSLREEDNNFYESWEHVNISKI